MHFGSLFLLSRFGHNTCLEKYSSCFWHPRLAFHRFALLILDSWSLRISSVVMLASQDLNELYQLTHFSHNERGEESVPILTRSHFEIENTWSNHVLCQVLNE